MASILNAGDAGDAAEKSKSLIVAKVSSLCRLRTFLMRSRLAVSGYKFREENLYPLPLTDSTSFGS